MTATNDGFRCPYCSDGFESSDRSREHPLSQVLGARWWRSSTCPVCNAKAGQTVDAPFADKLWIREQRHRHLVPDTRGKLCPAPELEGELADGTPVRVILHRDGWDVKLLPTVDELPGNEIRISVDASEDDPRKVLAKKRARLEKQLGKPIEDFVEDTREIDNPHVTARGLEDTFLWPRMGAKVALSAGHELLGDDWLVSTHACWLRDVLWGRPTEPPKPFAPLMPVDDVLEQGADGFGRFFRPPEHVVIVKNSDHGAIVQIILFGELGYRVPLGAPVAVETVWWMDPLARSVTRLAFGQFVQRIALRHAGIAA